MASCALHVLAVVIGQQVYCQLDFSLYAFGPKENYTHSSFYQKHNHHLRAHVTTKTMLVTHVFVELHFKIIK